ncbi:MAG: type I restriction endonuclease subunit R [Prochlorotrichaceae cyanobacterium]|jgi:hypothetical protein
MPIAITEAFNTLEQVEQQFGLQRREDPAFFPEWRSSLPDLSAVEQQELAKLRQRYLYQRSKGHLLEITALLLLVSPLLALAGFYDPPFTVRAEESIRLTLRDSEEVLQGRLDILVLWQHLWVVVVEAKKTTLSLWSALPQTLAYLQANPNPEQPNYGLITNGDEFAFVKLSRSGPTTAVYGLSRSFALLPLPEEFATVLQILKAITPDLP